MSHGDIRPDSRPAGGKVDHLHGLLFPQVCRQGACDAVETCRLVMEAERNGQSWRQQGPNLEQGLAAACRLAEIVQYELIGRLGQIVPHAELTQLANLHEMATNIAKAAKLTRVAKEAQLRAANGTPLTICVGKRARNLLTTEGLRVDAGPDGCGIVFPDTQMLERRMFRTCCDENWNNCEHKQRTRTATRRLNRTLALRRQPN